MYMYLVCTMRPDYSRNKSESQRFFACITNKKDHVTKALLKEDTNSILLSAVKHALWRLKIEGQNAGASSIVTVFLNKIFWIA